MENGTLKPERKTDTLYLLKLRPESEWKGCQVTSGVGIWSYRPVDFNLSSRSRICAVLYSEGSKITKPNESRPSKSDMKIIQTEGRIWKSTIHLTVRGLGYVPSNPWHYVKESEYMMATKSTVGQLHSQTFSSLEVANGPV